MFLQVCEQCCECLFFCALAYICVLCMCVCARKCCSLLQTSFLSESVPSVATATRRQHESQREKTEGESEVEHGTKPTRSSCGTALGRCARSLSVGERLYECVCVCGPVYQHIIIHQIIYCRNFFFFLNPSSAIKIQRCICK